MAIETSGPRRLYAVNPVPFRDVDAWLASPPSAWIVGTLEEVAEQLEALRGAGLSRVMLQHLLHTDLETVELIGRSLAPAVA